MVGNSFKSDIEHTVLQLGGYAVHIPSIVTWKLEQTEDYDHGHLCRRSPVWRPADTILTQPEGLPLGGRRGDVKHNDQVKQTKWIKPYYSTDQMSAIRGMSETEIEIAEAV